MLQMAMVLTFGAKVPVVKVGHMAGQFANPGQRLLDKMALSRLATEADIINELAFTEKARVPNAQKMLQVYTQAAAMLNLIRAFPSGGYADVKQVHSWTLGFTEGEKAVQHREMAKRIKDALDFMKAAGSEGKSAYDCVLLIFIQVMRVCF